MRFRARRRQDRLRRWSGRGTDDIGRLLRLLLRDFQLARLGDELCDLLLEGVEATRQITPTHLIVSSETRGAPSNRQGRYGKGEDQDHQEDFHGRTRQRPKAPHPSTNHHQDTKAQNAPQPADNMAPRTAVRFMGGSDHRFCGPRFSRRGWKSRGPQKWRSRYHTQFLGGPEL